MAEVPERTEGGERSEVVERKVRIWRRAFFGVYLLITGTACVWTLISILMVHCGYADDDRVKPAGPRISPQGDVPDELRQCHKKLARLLADLHKETFVLQAKALKYKIDPAVEWRNWSKAWRRRWKVLDHRCRLSELGGRGTSPEVDGMRDIHAALEELQVSYTGVMDRFVERYSHRLRRLSKKLRMVRDSIERRAKARAVPSQPTASGARQ